jgi:universal stress protein E
MPALQHIFAVIDPTQETQAALERAVNIASDKEDYVHAFLCDYSNDTELQAASSRSEAKHKVLTRSEERLGSILASLGQQPFTLGKEAYWNQNWPKSVTLASGRHGADLVIKNMSPLRDKKLRFKSADRYLLRNASCPVLLVLPEHSGAYKKILVAVDLETEDEAHLRLNNAAITAARQLAQRTNSELYLVAAYVDRLNDELLDDCENATQQEQIAQTFGVNNERVILEQGAAKDIILRTTKELNADVLVLGTSARKGLAGALVGNTAEKVLAEIPCDVLAVS